MNEKTTVLDLETKAIAAALLSSQYQIAALEQRYEGIGQSGKAAALQRARETVSTVQSALSRNFSDSDLFIGLGDK